MSPRNVIERLFFFGASVMKELKFSDIVIIQVKEEYPLRVESPLYGQKDSANQL